MDNKKELTQQNIDAIIGAYTSRVDTANFVRLTPNAKIAAQGYNLSVSTYVEQKDTREKVDIVVLNARIEEIVAREQVLREEIAKIIAEIEVDA